ncbi:hypothetical protein EWB00_003548 [Schistosoma japonicum]|uniref:Retrotransposon gag domain-containing protein n=1 Tax=Schistosoma japonicum TaxID=6182 RepID=A0A4Z2D892_SCHJA|nr:hypothetical protein EWB00_003548 [Schistosoma japonicum]
MQTVLDRCPAGEYLGQMIMALSDDIVRRVTTVSFSRSNSITKNWATMDECSRGCQDTLHHLRKFFGRQRQEESTIDYQHELRHLPLRVLPSMSVAEREMFCSRFTQGLKDRELQLPRFRVQSVSGALKMT